MKNILYSCLLAMLLGGLSSCGGAAKEEAPLSADTAASAPKIKTEKLSYTADSTTAESYVAFDESKSGKLPVVLVVPEWWGLNEYAQRRARELAELGYFALAVDMYGKGAQAADPAQAQALATPFYQNAEWATSRLQAAVAAASRYANADTGKVAGVGYCFGGSMLLNAAKLGMPFKAVVSFHGGLAGVAPKGKPLARILVLHGAADQFVPASDVAQFRKQLDSVKADYMFKEYADATHAFTNPDATENGKKFNLPISYNGAADTASWQEMKTFLAEVLR